MNLQEHKAILTFLDNMLRDAAEEPLDLEADAIIRAYFKRNPEAAYRLTKRAMSMMSPVIANLPDESAQRRRWLPIFRNRQS